MKHKSCMVKINKFRNWLEKNKIFFEVFFFSLVPIIIGLVSYQNSKEQLRLSQVDHSPIYRINEYIDYDSLTGRRLNHYITLNNDGFHAYNCTFKPMAFLNITFTKMNYTIPREEYHLLIPLKAYFGVGVPTNNSKGYLGHYVSINNAKFIDKLSNDLGMHSHVVGNYFISWPLAIITHVDYIDYAGNKIVEYYYENQQYSHYKVDYNEVKPYIKVYEDFDKNFQEITAEYILATVKEYLDKKLVIMK